jgi:hypothetical protein
MFRFFILLIEFSFIVLAFSDFYLARRSLGEGGTVRTQFWPFTFSFGKFCPALQKNAGIFRVSPRIARVSRIRERSPAAT